MSTVGQFSSKNPTIKRIHKEASELAKSPSPDYHAAPLESDLFEWHFTIRGPPAPSAFAGGLYHGRIVLPPAYPLKPPSFRFLTPSGRFEVNREICLSISGHHEETWQPAWGIRTALVAIRSFMDTDAKGQVGGMDASEETRKRLAGQSAVHRCAACAKTNHEIMKEQDELIAEIGNDKKTANEEVPEELRLAYREDLAKTGSTPQPAALPTPAESAEKPVVISSSNSAAQPPVAARSTTAANAPAPASIAIDGQPRVQQQTTRPADTAWIDKAIIAVSVVLAAMLWFKYHA